VNPPLYIALRFLGHRKRAFLLSLSGVVFGVAIFVCSQAQTQGFEKHFITATLGNDGGLILGSRFQPRAAGLTLPARSADGEAAHRRNFEGVVNPTGIMRVSRQFGNVVCCAPVLRGLLSARAGFETATVDLFGIDPTAHLQTTNLGDQIIDGTFDEFRSNPRALIVGSRLAEALLVRVGGTLQLLSPGGDYQRFTVAAISRSGVAAVDAARMYCHASVAQKLFLKPYTASLIVYKLRDPERAPALAKHFETLFGHTTESWQERHEGTLRLLVSLRLSAAITVSLVILLAGFGIFNVLTMTVLAKVREIAILRSMGYRQKDVAAIFLWQGALIAAVGSFLGCVLGALMTWGISKIPMEIRGLIYANHFVVAWDWRHYFWATVLAIVAVFIASYVPAKRAAALAPAAILRGSSV
jgi:lipoprotein-releasing system permease protein